MSCPRSLHGGVVAVLLLTTATATPAPQAASPAEGVLELNRPVVIAHRGFSSLAPENTLPSFQLALAAAADLIELDTHHSRDGVPVVIHDAELDRTTDATRRWGGAKLPVSTKSVADLKRLDAGAWFSPRYANTRLPTLAEALDTIQGGGGITLIERKGGAAPTLAALLRRKEVVNRVVVQSFDWVFLREFHAALPEQVLGALGPPGRLPDGRTLRPEDKILSRQWLDTLADTAARVVVWSKAVTRESVALAHQRGLKVWVYTIDDARTANALLDLGVDGIITNNPATLWRTLALRRPKAP